MTDKIGYVICVPPACQRYIFWWLPLDISGVGGRASSEQV